MKTGYIVVLCAVVLCCTSCTAIRHSGTHDLKDGYYVLKTGTVPHQQVYAVITEDNLALHLLSDKTKQPDVVPFSKIAIGPSAPDSLQEVFTLIKKSIDLDMSTVLFKYRFNRNALPNQLSSNLNFALYCGYRHDYYQFRMEQDPLMNYKRAIRHFEFDMGVFAGFGSTPMNPSVTANAISVEYDGVIFQKGIALFIGSRNFTIGLGIGTDGLMDRNRKSWIYQEKPWMGVMIGLNLTD